MAIDRVKTYFRQYGMEEKVKEFDVSSATVELAAQALSCKDRENAVIYGGRSRDADRGSG